MLKKYALAAALVCFAALLTGCAMEDTAAPENTAETGVDIVVPYATTTVAPAETQVPDALYIGADGDVVLNDDSLLNDTAGGAAINTDGSHYSQLRLGDTGEAVSDMQERLAELGYYTGGISGVFDENTETAVKLFERGYGTMQTGIATAAMQERLYSDEATVYMSDAYNAAVESHYRRLEEGDTGSAVIALQTRLQELGYPITEITGVYDEQTCEAVGLFYEMYGYDARDYAIVDMQKQLYSESALPYIDPADIPEVSSGDALALSQGDSGTRVTQLQIRLKELGYLSESTGVYGSETAEAVSAFQTACSLEPTGIADVDTQQQLFAADAPQNGEIKQIYAILQWGDTGEAVRALQERLAELGYYQGEADGIFSDDMVSTVKRFQAAAGMEETGVATVELQEAAFSDSAPLSPEKVAEAQADQAAANVVINALIKGDKNDDVRALQERLAELGYYEGAMDGSFGGGTEQAVMALQQAMGLEPTGEASADFINIIMSGAAPRSGRKYWKYTQNYQPLDIGDTGDEVVALQKRLWELGYLDKDDISSSIGTYEEYTAAAVNDVMKTLGCARRDGRASAEFLTVLYSSAADALKK